MKIALVNIKAGLVESSAQLGRGDRFYLCSSRFCAKLELSRFPDLTGIVHMAFVRRRRFFEYEAVSSQAQVCMRSEKGILNDGGTITIGHRTYSLIIERNFFLRKRVVKISVLAIIFAMIGCAGALFIRNAMKDDFHRLPSDDGAMTNQIVEERQKIKYAQPVSIPSADRLMQYWRYLNSRLDPPLAIANLEKSNLKIMQPSFDVDAEIEYAKITEMYYGCDRAIGIYIDIKKRLHDDGHAYMDMLNTSIERCDRQTSSPGDEMAM